MKNKITPSIKIVDWWISWWTENENHKIGMIVLINDELRFIEKELEND